MGIYALGVNLGLLIAYLAGGWMSEHYGWRVTIIAVGALGLLIALLVRFTVDEPIRGASDDATEQAAAPAFWTVAKYMWNTPATRQPIFVMVQSLVFSPERGAINLASFRTLVGKSFSTSSSGRFQVPSAHTTILAIFSNP